MPSSSEGKKTLKKEANGTLWNLIINAGDERPDKRERETGRDRYTLRRTLLMKRFENDDG